MEGNTARTDEIARRTPREDEEAFGRAIVQQARLRRMQGPVGVVERFRLAVAVWRALG